MFSAPWRLAVGRSGPLRPKPSQIAVSIVSQLVMAFVLGGIIGEMGPVTMEGGIVVGCVAWLGFVATSIAVNDSFAGSPLTLTMIDAGHWLVVLMLMGATIGLLSGGV